MHPDKSRSGKSNDEVASERSLESESVPSKREWPSSTRSAGKGAGGFDVSPVVEGQRRSAVDPFSPHAAGDSDVFDPSGICCSDYSRIAGENAQNCANTAVSAPTPNWRLHS